jgi:serine/threonine protein kinase
VSHPLSDAALRHLQTVVDWPAIPSDRYELLELAGRGGMGAVYLARDRELDRLVAIKVLGSHITSVAEGEHLVREAKILARLEHPGIVPVHDVGVTPDGRPYYVMKLVKGQDLTAHAGGGLTPGAALQVFERICDAVAFAHAQGVIHRDLKPGNVMVGAFGEVLVMDWGIAKFGEAAESPGTVFGTPGYMAPEQARGDVGHTDQRADVFSLGDFSSFWSGRHLHPRSGPSRRRPRPRIPSTAIRRWPSSPPISPGFAPIRPYSPTRRASSTGSDGWRGSIGCPWDSFWPTSSCGCCSCWSGAKGRYASV